MANPPRKKGTGFETERVNAWVEDNFEARRMPQGSPYDNHIRGWDPSRAPWFIEALTMRADRGEAVSLITHEDLRRLARIAGVDIHEECKRFARVSAWSIFKKKFRR